MTLKLLYFASIRERVGKSEEMIELPPSVATVADLATWLATRGPEYAAAFEHSSAIRAAIDKAHVKMSVPIGKAREIAFFPPVTGG